MSSNELNLTEDRQAVREAVARVLYVLGRPFMGQLPSLGNIDEENGYEEKD